jgi:hypothetical protein
MKYFLLTLGLITFLTSCNGPGGRFVGKYKDDDDELITITDAGDNLYLYKYQFFGRDGVGQFEGQKNVGAYDWELLAKYDKDCSCLKINSPTGLREAVLTNDGRLFVNGKPVGVKE